jgi:hypothetical protein
MSGLKTKTLRRMLKKAGLKVSGKKATLQSRAKKAHIIRGGQAASTMSLGSAAESMPIGHGQAGGGWAGDGNASYPTMEAPGLVGDPYMLATGGRRGLKAKTLKKILKKAGLKTSGKKAALTKRAKSARLIRGGAATSSSGSNEQMYPLNPSGMWGVSNF